MCKQISVFLFSSILVFSVAAQEGQIDSLRKELAVDKTDTASLLLYGNLAYNYSELNPDSALLYASKTHELAKRMKLRLEESFALAEIGYALINLGNYPRSLQNLLAAAEISNDPASERNILPSQYAPMDVYTDRTVSPAMQRFTKQSRAFQYLGILYANSGNARKAIDYYWMSIPAAEQGKNYRMLTITYTTMIRVYLTLNKKDSAMWAVGKAEEYSAKANFHKYQGSLYLNTARVYLAMGKQEQARNMFFSALHASIENKYYRGIAASSLALADIFKQSGQRDTVLYYINNGLAIARYMEAPDLFLRSYKALADYYRTGGNNDSAVKYQSLIIRINDSLFNSKQVQDFQNIDFNEQQRKQDIEAANAEYRSKMQIYLLLAGLGIFVLVAIILWRNSRQRRLANITLSKQKKELESTLESLRSTQEQLIQSEKMASLGEMTAGIAHEIQNPLNFVNNFSEVNNELIEELKSKKGELNSEELHSLLDDIFQNNEKINHHGKRADSIVKGMLQHSRSTSGQKELTDINALADEYLRLAYHGLRAKDKTFNAKFETDLDHSIGKINLVPQDIGRVILNLINNAFYAVSQKKAQMHNSIGTSYEPTVTVSTRKIDNMIQVNVKDNGLGIPASIVNKIFQPFFTTKPAGHGTGLGLSLSYDIIKNHGGNLEVNTKEGEYTKFIITLPA